MAVRVVVAAATVAAAGLITTAASAPKQAAAAVDPQQPGAAPATTAPAMPATTAPEGAPQADPPPRVYPLACRGKNELLYNLQGGETDPNGVHRIIIPSAGEPDVLTTAPVITAAHLADTVIGKYTVNNMVGVSSADNQRIIFVVTNDNGINIVDYNVAEQKPYVQPVAPGVGGVGGVVNLKTGLYYFGSVGSPSQEAGFAVLNTYNPTDPANIKYKALRVRLGQKPTDQVPNPPVQYGSNGDIAFDSNGSLYIVTSSGTDYWVHVVLRPDEIVDPEHPEYRDSILVATGKTNAMNGFAFGSDGYIYASVRTGLGPSKGGTLSRFHPVSGDNKGNYDLAAPSDLASCADPNRIRLYKNLPGGRYNETDQFEVEIISADGLSIPQKGTTVGTDVGLQDKAGEFAGPAIGLGGGKFTIVEKGVGGADLANYVTTWKCIDESQGNREVAQGTGSTGDVTLPSDGGVDVNCVFTNIPKSEIKVQKDLPNGRLVPGDQFRLSITPGGAPDATTTGSAVGLQTEVATLTEALPGTTYTITESPAGTTTFANYTATWSCVDNGNGGVPFANGTGFTGTLTIPNPGGPKRHKIVCTFTNIPIISQIVPSKSVNPPDGSTVYVGDSLTYTLTFDNPGSTPANVNYTDDLNGVIDDAEITAPPKLATGTGLTVTPPAGGKFTMTGTVPPKSSATVTYSVKVKPDDQRGDNDLLNYLFPTGTPTPPTCPVGNALCTENPVPEPVVSKSVNPADGSTVQPGQTLTYTLTFDNTLGKAPAPIKWTDNVADVLDDATVITQPTPSSTAITASPITNNEFTVQGSLPAGAKTTVIYQVQVKPDGQRVNNDLLNYLFPTGTKPPSTCAVGDPLCTENPVPQPGASKSANPPSGTTVNVGQTVTYTLKFDNAAGKAPAPIAWDDDISGVLDDATLTSPPVSSDPSLTAQGPSARGLIKVTGTLAAGKSATVTYKVQVKPDDQRGDNILLNFMFPPGTEPPTQCVVGNQFCTAHPVPEPVISKSVDPTDGSTVLPGQTVTWTQTFDNTLGKADAPLNWTDDLSGVLDDATITSAPVSSDPAVTASPIASGRFTVTGRIPAGKKVTVTYKAQVKPDGQRGDNVLLNFLFPTGTTPPSTCVVGDPFCTENPVPEPVVTKSVDPADGSTVLPGQTVTYTLGFDNTKGKAAVPIDWDDDISGVLDDATMTAPPTASDPALVASAPSTRGIIKITGTLAAGKKITVTYKVQVKPDGQRGDNDLLNYLFPTGTTPPSTCVAGDPLCTEHPVPEPVVSKTVDPLDGSTVNPEQVLTYTMTFSNAKGKAPAEIAWDDNLSQVLDDANVTEAPKSSNAALTVSAITNGAFTIRGTLAPGQTVTVTMKVQVKPDGQRGDNDLLNFLMKPGTPVPPTCAVGDPLCTENPVPSVPSINLDKTVVVVTETAGQGLSTPGDVVTYGFKVTNTGNVTLTNIVLTDPKLSTSPLTCPKTTLQPGESMDCTAPTYTLTNADLAAGRAVNVATVTGKPPVGPNVNDTDDAVVPVYPPSVIPATGSNLPSRVGLMAPAIMLAGAILLLLGARRRYGLGAHFK